MKIEGKRSTYPSRLADIGQPIQKRNISLYRSVDVRKGGRLGAGERRHEQASGERKNTAPGVGKGAMTR